MMSRLGAIQSRRRGGARPRKVRPLGAAWLQGKRRRPFLAHYVPGKNRRQTTECYVSTKRRRTRESLIHEGDRADAGL